MNILLGLILVCACGILYLLYEVIKPQGLQGHLLMPMILAFGLTIFDSSNAEPFPVDNNVTFESPTIIYNTDNEKFVKLKFNNKYSTLITIEAFVLESINPENTDGGNKFQDFEPTNIASGQGEIVFGKLTPNGWVFKKDIPPVQLTYHGVLLDPQNQVK